MLFVIFFIFFVLKLTQSSFDDFHRKHGLSLPLDYPQVLAWFLAAAPLVMFFIFVFPATKKLISYFFVIPFSAFYLIAVVLFVFCTLETHPYPPLLTNEQSHYCKYCDEYVPNNAKHCRACNKCRVGFDHHCRYINNCVTSNNYTMFYFGILCFFAAAAISIGALCYIAGKYDIYKDQYLDELSEYLNNNISTVVFWVLYGLTFVIDLALSVPLGALIGYHIFFQANNITTYDYILKDTDNYPEELIKFTCLPGRDEKIQSIRFTE